MTRKAINLLLGIMAVVGVALFLLFIYCLILIITIGQ